MNCDKCHIGHLRPVAAPYLRWIDGRIMVISDAPALACDICDNLVYEPDFESKLQFFLDQLDGEEQVDKRIIEKLILEEFSHWQATRRGR